jgi:coiled-coil domain-containing protein 61
MLRAGLVDSSSAVFVDLLTYQDLEQLKRRRSGGAGGAVGVETSFDGPKPDANAPSNVSRGKRYLILTHADEFDRTHYPLPLRFEDEPSCATLMAQVARLKQENELLRRDAGPGGDVSGVIGRGALSGRDDDEMDSLRLENERLTDRLDVVESGAGDASYENAPPHYAQMSALQQEVKVLTRELGATKRDLVEVQKAAKGFAVEVQNAEVSISQSPHSASLIAHTRLTLSFLSLRSTSCCTRFCCARRFCAPRNQSSRKSGARFYAARR